MIHICKILHEMFVKIISFGLDRFQCKLCPGFKPFPSDFELQCHFFAFHRGVFYFPPSLPTAPGRRAAASRRPKASTLNSWESSPQKGNKSGEKMSVVVQGQFNSTVASSSKSLKLKSCIICGKAGIDSDNYNEHRKSHMNKAERDIFLKAENDQESPKKKRMKRSNVVMNFGAEQNCPPPPPPPSIGLKICWKKCETCGELIPNGEPGMEKHMLTHKPPTESYQLDGSSCRYPNCRKHYSNDENLKKHVQLEHKALGNEWMCRVCGRVFKNETRLTTHANLHSEEKKSVCHVCQKEFSDGLVLRDHLASVHGENEIFKCPETECGAEFKGQWSFNSHMRKVHGISVKEEDVKLEVQSNDEGNNIASVRSTRMVINPADFTSRAEFTFTLMAQHDEEALEVVESTVVPFNNY